LARVISQEAEEIAPLGQTSKIGRMSTKTFEMIADSIKQAIKVRF